ncbi:hypothetical protein P692DRAFT_201806414 [Suillus brevipes Sb2]|nr:hypothetical protein P692DRAFT_201806414 [Suillus brevipes Sb2]
MVHLLPWAHMGWPASMGTLSPLAVRLIWVNSLMGLVMIDKLLGHIILLSFMSSSWYNCDSCLRLIKGFVMWTTHSSLHLGGESVKKFGMIFIQLMCTYGNWENIKAEIHNFHVSSTLTGSLVTWG